MYNKKIITFSFLAILLLIIIFWHIKTKNKKIVNNNIKTVNVSNGTKNKSQTITNKQAIMSKSQNDNIEINKIKKEVEGFESLISILNTPNLNDKLTEEQKEQRTKYFDAWNNPAIMGDTGSPYDSKEYREMTNAILSQEEINIIIKNTKDLNSLLDIAMSLFAGDGSLRDVPAARQIMEYIILMSKDNNFSIYLNTTRTLGENYALPIADNNLEYAKKLFSKVFNMCLEKKWDDYGVQKDVHQINEYWSMMGLAYCYERQGLNELAEEIYNKFKEKSKHSSPQRLDIAVKFAKLLNRARMINPSPDTLMKLADEFDKLANYDRKISNGKNNHLIDKCLSTAKSLRNRSQKLNKIND